MKKQRHQTNTAKLTDLLSVFIQFFFVLFYSRLYCFNQILYCFLWEKVGGSKKSRLLGGSEKNRLLVWKNCLADNVTGVVRNDNRLPERKL